MRVDKLPNGLTPKGSSPTFTKDTLPDALCSEHALAAGRWGVLHVLEGAALFVDLTSGESRRITAPDQVVIAPIRPHKLELCEGPLLCRVDFFQEQDQAAPSSHTEEHGKS